MTTLDPTFDHVYSVRWHDERRAPIDPMDEKQARRAWDKGPILSVSGGEGLGDGTSGVVPAYTLEMDEHADNVRAIHYNSAGDRVAELDYELRDDGLFLEEVAEYLYDEPDGPQKAFRLYFFRDDGYCRVTTEISGADAQTVEEFSDVDVSSNWLAPLEWGDWDRVGLHESGFSAG